MQGFSRLTGSHQFTIQVHCYESGPVDHFNGTITVEGCEQPLAFSGLAQFWLTIERLRKQAICTQTDVLQPVRQSAHGGFTEAANEFSA